MESSIVTTPQNALQDTAITTLLDDWHAALTLRVQAGELATNTGKTYMTGMNRFLTWLEDADAETHAPYPVTGDILRAWMADLRSNDMAPNTVSVWLAGVRAFFGWATGNARLLHDPTHGVKGAERKGTSKRHKRGVLTPTETRRVLSHPVGARDRAILHIMAYTAARTVEIHRADLQDLKTEGGRLVLYVQGKGRDEKDEMLVIAHPDAQDAVHGWLAVRGDKPGPLFVSHSNRDRDGRLSLRSIRRMVIETYKAVGVRGENKTTHSLRHTAITTAIRNGAPIQKVRAMARHSSIETTMIYFHEVDRLENPAEDFVSY